MQNRLEEEKKQQDVGDDEWKKLCDNHPHIYFPG